MIPAKFDYVRVTTAADAVAALGTSEDAKILGGGQSLIPILRLRLAAPELIVDVSGCSEMTGVSEDGDAIVIGAATTHHDVLNNPLVREHAPLLAQATATVADPQVRHRGTFGGAIAHADPAGDLPGVTLVHGATMTIAGPGGTREVAASDFFVDYLTTTLAEDEVLVSVRLPKLGAGWGTHYEKFNRVAQAWSIVGVAAAVRRESGSIAEARIALTNMGPTHLRAAATEAALAGSAASAEAITAAAASAAEGTNPTSDLNAQADYRAELARVLTGRAVAKAAGLS
ncbi:xanthine dehydrogenase family protein subunit M [Sporichthya brevicatena]|uniref:Xanthine dehydrogenase family protein subunit M n=1 Tax=Sporichthya brevicatena TaxID=171442 RepID=A0ABP3SD47_9ACTN